MKYQRQTPILEFKDDRVDNLNYSLSLCGRMASKNFYCRQCEKEEKPALLKTSHKRFCCEVRYCSNSPCLIQRFVRQMLTFGDIQRFEGLRTLWHFVIGFEPITYLEFRKNFSKHKKRFEGVLNKYFEKLKKAGLIIPSIRVLDFSFTSENMVYVHYHFGAIPVKSSLLRETLKLMQGRRMSMISKQRNKIPFHLQSFGYKSLLSVCSYLSIRASGMYKYESTQNFTYTIQKSSLFEAINKGKYIFLSSVLTKEEYIKSFYGKAHFVTIGGLPRPVRHGTNITDGIPQECVVHGKLERKDIRIEIIFDDIEKSVLPPNLCIEKLNYSYEIVSRTDYLKDYFALCTIVE
jgi:hypothetical protein